MVAHYRHRETGVFRLLNRHLTVSIRISSPAGSFVAGDSNSLSVSASFNSSGLTLSNESVTTFLLTVYVYW